MRRISDCIAEELPDHGQMCVVRDSRGSVHYAYRSGRGEWRRIGTDELIEATHWERIPDPMKGHCRAK